MGVQWRPAIRGYLRFVGLLLLICGGLLLVGYLATARTGDRSAAAAIATACALSFAGSAVGGLVVAAGAAGAIAPGPGVALLSMGARLLLVAGLAAVIAVNGFVEPRTFLLWVAISYLACLAADVFYALRAPS